MREDIECSLHIGNLPSTLPPDQVGAEQQQCARQRAGYEVRFSGLIGRVGLQAQALVDEQCRKYCAVKRVDIKDGPFGFIVVESIACDSADFLRSFAHLLGVIKTAPHRL